VFLHRYGRTDRGSRRNDRVNLVWEKGKKGEKWARRGERKKKKVHKLAGSSSMVARATYPKDQTKEQPSWEETRGKPVLSNKRGKKG